MAREHLTILPVLQRILSGLGEHIRLARLRRRFSESLVAQRAGIARNTLRAIESGDPSVTFGAYANVLLSLGLEQDLKLIAKDDELGRKLQDAGLSVKARAPRINKAHLIRKK
jgi:transcriptional regulator with XRE-family HTH domain